MSKKKALTYLILVVSDKEYDAVKLVFSHLILTDD